MNTPTGQSAQHLLDGVRTPPDIEAFPVERFLQRLAAELDDSAATEDAAELRDDRLRAALAAIDAFASRAMRIRLDYLLVERTPLERPFRKYLASRVLDYHGKVEQLRARVAEVACRVDPDGGPGTAEAVANAAGDVLSLRAALRTGVLALVPPDEPEQPAEEPRKLTRAELIELD